MADNATFDLPGTFEKGKKYLLDGETLAAWQKNLKADRIVVGDGIKETQTPQGRIIKSAAAEAALSVPFRLVVKSSGGTYYWRVESDRSTVTNGANGPAIDLSGAGFDTDYSFAAKRWIVLQASVDSSLATSSWTLLAVTSAADAKEIHTTTDTPPVQDLVRLFIGVVETAPLRAIQAVTTAQELTTVLANGMYCRGFRSAPANPASL